MSPHLSKSIERVRSKMDESSIIYGQFKDEPGEPMAACCKDCPMTGGRLKQSLGWSSGLFTDTVLAFRSFRCHKDMSRECHGAKLLREPIEDGLPKANVHLVVQCHRPAIERLTAGQIYWKFLLKHLQFAPA